MIFTFDFDISLLQVLSESFVSAHAVDSQGRLHFPHPALPDQDQFEHSYGSGMLVWKTNQAKRACSS